MLIPSVVSDNDVDDNIADGDVDNDYADDADSDNEVNENDVSDYFVVDNDSDVVGDDFVDNDVVDVVVDHFTDSDVGFDDDVDDYNNIVQDVVDDNNVDVDNKFTNIVEMVVCGFRLVVVILMLANDGYITIPVEPYLQYIEKNYQQKINTIKILTYLCKNKPRSK